MLIAVNTTQVFAGWDVYGEEETFTKEIPETRRVVSVEEATLLPDSTHLYWGDWGDERIHRPGHYAGAKWSIGNAGLEAATLIELVAYLSLSTVVV